MAESPEQVERRFMAALSAIDGIVWTNNPDGEMVGEQPGWASLTGQSFDEYQGYGWSAAIHPDDAEPTVTAWRVAVAASAPFVFEHRVRRSDGEWRVFAVRAIPVKDAEGKIVEWLGVHHDITDRRIDEEKIRQIADTFTALFKSNPFGIYVVDADFKLTHVSQGACSMFANIDPLIGRDFAEILRIVWAKPFAARAIELFRHTLTTGEPYANPDGVGERGDTHTSVSYDWRIDRIILPDGRYGVVCHFYDLSERKAQEERLQQALAEKDLLAREIDHRVKNSLMIVTSLLTMQRSKATSRSERDALAEAGDRVMAVARIHEGLYKSHDLGIIAFDDYVEQLCRDMQHSFGIDTVAIDVRTTPIALPAETALSLALIINELTTNAFKHGYPNGATLISVHLDRVDNRLILKVADNGAGMPDRASDKASGLGLSLIEAVSQQLAAKIDLPAPGAPAVFTIEISMSAPTSGDLQRQAA